MLEQRRQRIRKEMEARGAKPAIEFEPNFTVSQLEDLEVDGIDFTDYPDFCDSFISAGMVAEPDGSYRDLTEEELDWINDNHTELAQELAYEEMCNY